MSLFVVVVDGNDDLGPFDAIYGYEPVVFRSEEQAWDAAALLGTTGDWPGGQPSYHVERVEEDAIEFTYNMHFRRGVK